MKKLGIDGLHAIGCGNSSHTTRDWYTKSKLSYLFPGWNFLRVKNKDHVSYFSFAKFFAYILDAIESDFVTISLILNDWKLCLIDYLKCASFFTFPSRSSIFLHISLFPSQFSIFPSYLLIFPLYFFRSIFLYISSDLINISSYFFIFPSDFFINFFLENVRPDTISRGVEEGSHGLLSYFPKFPTYSLILDLPVGRSFEDSLKTWILSYFFYFLHISWYFLDISSHLIHISLIFLHNI